MLEDFCNGRIIPFLCWCENISHIPIFRADHIPSYSYPSCWHIEKQCSIPFFVQLGLSETKLPSKSRASENPFPHSNSFFLGIHPPKSGAKASCVLQRHQPRNCHFFEVRVATGARTGSHHRRVRHLERA